MTKLSAARMDMQGGRLDASVLKYYGETLVGGSAGTNTTATYTVDLSTGNVFNLILNANCTFTFTNPFASGTETSFTIILKQGYGTSSFVPTWPAAVVWPSGTKPTFTAPPGNVAIYTFYTVDGGTRWFGSSGSPNYGVDTLFSWGLDNPGQLGDNTTTNKSSPVQVSGTTWAQVAAGLSHTMALRTDGTLWAWGLGGNGQLGNNTSINKSSPVQIAGTTWSQVSSSGNHALAIRTDGTLWLWGYNVYGRLGDGTTVNKSSPVQIAGTTWALGFANSGAVLGGISAAIKTDGTLWTWGTNTYGQLGNNATLSRSSPIQVAGTAWAQVAGSRSHTIALRTDGTLWTWGENLNGALGDNTALTRSSPVQISGTTWSQITAGALHSLALRTDGTLWTWGSNVTGRLGDNTTINKSSPVQVAGSWIMASGGLSNSAALKSDGTLWIWGDGLLGKSGDNTTTSRSSPVQISGTTWAQVSAGASHTAAIRSTL